MYCKHCKAPFVFKATNRPNNLRKPHIKDAWQAIQAVLPAPASTLYKLRALNHDGCDSPQAFVGYMVREGYLRVKCC